MLTLVMGHRVVDVGGLWIGEFPHLCPGEGCAVAAWIARHPPAGPSTSRPKPALITTWPELVASELERESQ